MGDDDDRRRQRDDERRRRRQRADDWDSLPVPVPTTTIQVTPAAPPIAPDPPVTAPVSAGASVGSPEYKYAAICVGVVDGDTVDVDVLLGFWVVIRQRIRVYGINTPETHTTDAAEKVRGLAACEFARGLLPVGGNILIRSYKPSDPLDKFGRWLANITLADGSDFAAKMIAAGHALPYFGVGAKPI